MRFGLLIRVRDRAVVLDQVRALLDEELGLAIRAEELDAGVAQVLVMDVEFLVALGAAGIEMLDHLGFPLGRCLLLLIASDRDRARGWRLCVSAARSCGFPSSRRKTRQSGGSGFRCPSP